MCSSNSNAKLLFLLFQSNILKLFLHEEQLALIIKSGNSILIHLPFRNNYQYIKEMTSLHSSHQRWNHTHCVKNPEIKPHLRVCSSGSVTTESQISLQFILCKSLCLTILPVLHPQKTEINGKHQDIIITTSN